MNNSFQNNLTTIDLKGKGLFSKDEVNVSINSADNENDIVFVVNNEKISAHVKNIINTARNTVLGKNDQTICLVEHFLSCCSVLGINNIEVTTNKNELIFDDGSALHWYRALKEFSQKIKLKYFLSDTLFIKKGDKIISCIPSDSFKVSYFMDYNNPLLKNLWVSWSAGDNIERLLRSRTFAKKEENEFFGVAGRILSMTEDGFDIPLYEPLEPPLHKILDIIGDLRLSGINPLEIAMHVISFKGGHDVNVELAKEINQVFC